MLYQNLLFTSTCFNFKSLFYQSSKKPDPKAKFQIVKVAFERGNFGEYLTDKHHEIILAKRQTIKIKFTP